MRLTEFWRLMDEEFGAARARVLADHQSLSELGSVTARAALDRGEAPKRVWLAVCAEMDVPPSRRLGRDRPLRRN